MILQCSFCPNKVERNRSYTIIRCMDCKLKKMKDYSLKYRLDGRKYSYKTKTT